MELKNDVTKSLPKSKGTETLSDEVTVKSEITNVSIFPRSSQDLWVAKMDYESTGRIV